MVPTDTNPQFVLASASPRRRELLQQIGCRFLVAPVHLDETPLPGELPEHYVVRMALEKARAGWSASREQGRPVLAADTTVVCEGEIFGKPGNREEAVAMLERLSDRSHRVLSAVALCNASRCESRLSETEVRFRAIDEAERQRYWETGEPADKAGGYGIQGYGAVFITAIHGSYSGVVGLPLAETCELLSDFGLSWWMSV
ncbi:MAG: septum formation inhibitor Maf [Gammaproteobacteria bacterium]|nr:MAG: septum formation inhibitor Maf [Gammaproteobacteria bacterium]